MPLDPVLPPLDLDLVALAALAGNGLATRTGTHTWAVRTVTGTADEITVVNGDGVSGNPTLSLPTALTFTGKTITGGTINGVVVNATSIGATTPDTGAFTTLNASGATIVTSSSGITSRQATTQDSIRILGRAGGTGTRVATITTPTLSGSITLTLPASTAAFATLALTETLTNKTLTSPAINTATIIGGTINSATIGLAVKSTGAFTFIGAGSSPTSTDSIFALSTIGVNAATLKNSPNGSGAALILTSSTRTIAESDTLQMQSISRSGETAFGITVGGQVLLGAGTAAAPALAIDGDNNTGIYQVGADQLGISAGGGLRVTVSTAALTLSSGINLIMSGAGLLTTGTGAVSLNGPTTITQDVATSGSPTLLTLTGPAHTTLAASTEQSDVFFALGRSVQFATGPITTIRAFRLQAPTYAFVGASTITTAATLAISGSPAPGTNATITNRYALWIQGGDSLFTGSVTLASGHNLIMSGASTATFGTGAIALNGNTTIASGKVLVLPTTTPASAAATGTAGTYTWDTSYLYVCTATNAWKRVAIATW